MEGSNLNYCLVKKNKIYEEITDLMDMEELSMNMPTHTDKIKYQLKKLVSNSKYIQLIGNESNTNNLLEEVIMGITKEDNNPNLQGNTMLLYGNDLCYYEVIYMENLRDKNKKDENLNEFASISNINLEPIYGDCAILKTCYENNTPTPGIITLDDVSEILINNFYHMGLMIEPTGKTIELIYSGDSPNNVIGHKFEKTGEINVLGLVFVPWIEKGKELNTIASKVLGKDIYGRVFLTVLAPIYFRRFWGINTKTLDDITKILDDKTKVEQIQQELSDSSNQINPFFLIKKYCI